MLSSRRGGLECPCAVGERPGGGGTYVEVFELVKVLARGDDVVGLVVATHNLTLPHEGALDQRLGARVVLVREAGGFHCALRRCRVDHRLGVSGEEVDPFEVGRDGICFLCLFVFFILFFTLVVNRKSG